MSSNPIQRLRPALGAWVTVACDGPHAQSALESAFAAIGFIESVMHPTRSDSDLTRIRNAPTGTAVRVHRWTWEVLTLSQRLNAMSEGVFDPCLPSAAGRMTQVSLPEPGVVVCTAPIALDLGGIAKGFAVDCAVDALIARGCDAGLVNAGGDLRVFGADARTIWIRTREGAWPLQLRNQACAVSVPRQLERPSEHRGYYCRIPTGLKSVDFRAALVMADTAAVADALTKCVGLSSLRGSLRSLPGALGARALLLDECARSGIRLQQ